ncbi:hypothetical protein D3C83_71190 [compost metagenome]
MTGISIFMDSMTMRVSPDSTLSPVLALTCQTVPVISDLISMRAMVCGKICAGKRGEYSMAFRAACRARP